MTMQKVVFYYRKDDGKIYKATLDTRQYYYALTYCRDYNSLLQFIDTVTNWTKCKEANE